MDEILDVLISILGEMKSLNGKLDDVYERLGDVTGCGACNSLSDVCDKLEEIHLEVFNFSMGARDTLGSINAHTAGVEYNTMEQFSADTLT